MLRATRTEGIEEGCTYEEQWASHPGQPLMPLLSADCELQSHRPHAMGTSLLGIAPSGPLCQWAEAEEQFAACIARRVYKAEIDAEPAAQEALLKERTRLEQVPVWDITQ